MKSITIHVAKKVYQSSKKALGLFTLALLLLSTFFIFSQTTVAQQLVCPQHAILQITDEPTGDSDDSAISADGRWIAFESQANIGGENPDGQNEIYLFDTTTSVITQITAAPSGSSSEPSINADGTLITFSSTSDIIGGGPAGNREIFLFDTTTGIFTQITDEPMGSSRNSVISSDGTRIAFQSTANIGGGNPDGRNEVYLFDTTTSVITQITDDPMEGSITPSINADGTRISFPSESDINGGNPEENFEIFLFDTTTGIFTQITNEMGTSTDSSINADGTRIAFESDANINGGNPELNIEIFLFDTTTGIFTQITSEPSGNSADPSINADGTRIAFRSESDINGGNPDGNFEVYLFDTVTGISTQVTNQLSGDSVDPSINADGTRIAFDSEANINGGNPEGNEEIYMATCLDPMTARNIPTLSEWGLIAMAGVLGIMGLLAIRRREVTA